MTLWEKAMKPCIMLDWRSTPDGLGGVKWQFTDGAPFTAAITLNNTTAMQVAYAAGQKKSYDVVTPKAMLLDKGDRFRTEDGTVYLVTGDSRDMIAPEGSGIPFARTTAEVVET